MTPLKPEDLDLMTRLVVAENNKADPDEQAAIAHVMLNRYASGDFGSSMQDVLKARTKGGGYQFTPLGTTNNSPYKVDPSSPAYQQARQVVEGAAQGSIPDPTNGATYYRNQEIAPGKPAGAVGAGTKIGAHTFFTTNAPAGGPSSDDAAAAQFLEQRRGAASASAPEPTGAEDADAAKFLEQRRAAISTPASQVSGDFDTLEAQPMQQMDISTPAGQAKEYAKTAFGPVADWAKQNPGTAGAVGATLAAPFIPIAGPAAVLSGVARAGIWPLIRAAAPVALGTEAVQHGEAAYQYGKNLLSSFAE